MGSAANVCLLLVTLAIYALCAAAGQATSHGNHQPLLSTTAQTGIGRRQTSVPDFQRWVYCFLRVRELSKVDGVEQSFYVDGSLACYYQEPLLAFTIGQGETFRLPSDTLDALRLWGVFFDPLFTNQRDSGVTSDRRTFLMGQLPDAFQQAIDRNETTLQDLPIPPYDLASVPWIATTMRVSGLFKAELQLQEFPFDRQTVQINITSRVPSRLLRFAEINWLPGTSVTGQTRGVIGWELIGESVVNATQYLPEYGDSTAYAGAQIYMKRLPDFFVNKIVIGVMFITLMSQLTFLIEPRDSNRFVASLTAFLGIVTFLFVIANDVPKVAYTTRMDGFVNTSFYFVFVDFVLHGIVYLIVQLADASEASAVAAAEDEKARRLKKSDDQSSENTSEEVTGWWTGARLHLRRGDFVLSGVLVVTYIAISLSNVANRS